MDPTLLLLGATGLLAGLGVVESAVHRRALRRIPIRIHVNGTRGKSGVTRLIAAGLRAGGIRTVAKTTGTLPRLILPDGSELAIERRSAPNVIEQVAVVRAAAGYACEALVAECMALQPALQSFSELKLIRATHGVITNVRPDHLDVMGPTVDDVALALAGTVPLGGKLFTAETRYLAALRAAAADRDATLAVVDASATAAIRPEELGRFSYIEHAENVALSLAVCQALGVPREAAIQGMWNATPDDGMMRSFNLHLRGKPIVFVNAMAANDPQSTGYVWDLLGRRFEHLPCRIGVFNCREDRPDRSRQLAEACVGWQQADRYLVIGSGTDAFVKTATAAGLNPLRIVQRECAPREGQGARDVLEAIGEAATGPALVVGMGNIAGVGMELMHEVHRAQREIPLNESMDRQEAA